MKIPISMPIIWWSPHRFLHGWCRGNYDRCEVDGGFYSTCSTFSCAVHFFFLLFFYDKFLFLHKENESPRSMWIVWWSHKVLVSFFFLYFFMVIFIFPHTKMKVHPFLFLFLFLYFFYSKFLFLHRKKWKSPHQCQLYDEAMIDSFTDDALEIMTDAKLMVNFIPLALLFLAPCLFLSFFFFTFLR